MAQRKKKTYNLKSKKLKQIQEGEITQEMRLELIALQNQK